LPDVANFAVLDSIVVTVARVQQPARQLAKPVNNMAH
jgi:hypothetical protein